MKAQTLRDYLSVHTWVGIVSGLLLFIAFYGRSAQHPPQRELMHSISDGDAFRLAWSV